MKGDVEKRKEHWKGWTGVLPAFVESVAFDLDLNLTLRDYFASAQSKDMFPGSSFTACVMDVRVGKLDACVGNFWVTAERLSLAHFVQPFGADNMYLVAPVSAGSIRVSIGRIVTQANHVAHTNRSSR